MRACLLLSVVLCLLGCGEGQRGAPAAGTGPPVAPGRDEPVAVVRGSAQGLRLGLLSLRRTGPEVVTATVRLMTTKDAPTPFSDEVELTALTEGVLNDDVRAMRLVDEVNGNVHFPLFDGEGRCLCSTWYGIPPGETADLYAKFPAPPADVRQVSLHVPGFPSFDGVRIDP